MRIVSISGTNDSGKTTVIKKLITILATQGKRSAVIVNEDGEETYDDDFISSRQISVEHLRGGWLGCSLAASLVQLKKKLKRTINPDYLFLEPSEMIVTKELRNVTKMGLRDIQYDIGPFITLIDGPSFSFNWEERPKLLLGQMQDADRVALSRTDMIDSKQIEHIRKILDVAGNNLLLLNKQNSSSINELAQQILLMDQET
jgi:G3E family GTPase